MDEVRFWTRRAESVREDDLPDEGYIGVMIPYWMYRRIQIFLIAIKSSAKPDDYIAAILEGHIRRLNL